LNNITDRYGMTPLPNNGLTMVDLFCGAGIGAVGFKNAGFNILFGIDNKQYAVDTYNLNIGEHAIKGDMRSIQPEDIPDADIITGGFPCTSFSVGGKGEGVEDKRTGDLGYHFYRIVNAKQPKAFLIENVAGLIQKKHRPFFDELVSLFEKSGYVVTWKLIDTWEHGVPQIRKRVFIIGIRKDLEKTFEFPSPIPLSERNTIRYAIGDLPEPNKENNHNGYGLRNDEKPFINKISPGGNWRQLPTEEQKLFMKGAFDSGGGRTGFLRKVSFKNPAHTLTSCMNGKNNAQILDIGEKYGVIKHQNEYFEGDYSPRYKSRNRQKQWDEPSFTVVSTARQLPLYPHPPDYDIRIEQETPPPRRFTVRECLRLQTVPDWFHFPSNVSLQKQYERCSGIPSLVAYKFGKEIAELLLNNNKGGQ